MAISKMRLVWCVGSKENIDEVLSKAFNSGYFQPELAQHIVNSMQDGVIYPEDTRFSDYTNRMDNIAHSLHFDLRNDRHDTSQFTNDDIEARITAVENKFEKVNEQLTKANSLTEDDRKAIQKLKEYDVSQLNEAKYVRSNFGRFPLSSVPKLAFHNNDRFIYTELHRTARYLWIYYICLEPDQKEIDEMFESLYFEPIAIPKFDETVFIQDCAVSLKDIYPFVQRRAAIAKLYKYVGLFDETLMLAGFVPETKIKDFKRRFEDHEDVIIHDFPADMEKSLTPPTVLRNNWFVKPFEMFVEMYSLPKYGGFDPTWYVSISYSILFGIMFGDLGQGLVLSLLGIVLYKWKKMKLGAIMARIGVFSAFFGLIYGSFFGNETLIASLWHGIGVSILPIEVMSPELTMPLLGTALGLGIFLIMFSMVYNIIKRLQKGDLSGALFTQNGVAGLIVYGSLIAGLVSQFLLQIKIMNTPYILGLIVFPLLVILFKEPLEHMVEKMVIKPKEGWGGYVVQAFFEVFEVMLSFLSNTMSFMRVGGFVLSHAGMMLVVTILNEMVGQYGLIVLIFGNIFVMALEGMIVGIQTLRLEYYELFSRYYDGGGRKFVPVTLENR